jgi:hypothetical protein
MVTYKNDKSNITDLRDITARHVTYILRDTSTLFNSSWNIFIVITKIYLKIILNL